MSGLEIAGVVLGAFPILISALESYKEGKQIFSDWWEYKRAYKNFKYEIEYQQLRFEQNVELYLLPLITDDDTLLYTLLQQPGGPAWRDRELEARLRERIPGSYTLYLQTIEAMNGVMGKLQSKLRRRPAVFAWSQKSRKTLLDTVEKYNTRLQQLLDISDRIKNLKQTQAPIKDEKFVLQPFQYANLYSALNSSWWCQSNHTHEAQLILPYRLDIEPPLVIIFMFGDRTTETTSAPIWDWQEGYLKVLSTEKRGFTIHPLNVPLNHQDSPVHHTTKGLCITLASCQERLERKLVKAYDMSFAFIPKHQTSMPEMIAFDSLLDGSSLSSLTRRDRYFIAFTIASSHIQLHSTPWLGAEWRKDKIKIRLERSGWGRIYEVRPYISKKFTRCPESPAEPAVSPIDYSFSTLGIILLELCFGKPFEDYELRKKFQCMDAGVEPILDHATATQWCNDVVGETGLEYYNAVKWCLDNTFERTEEWRVPFFERVVLPIRGCYDRLMMGLRPSHSQSSDRK